MDQVKFNKWLAAALALVVGIGAGIVGAAGAFLLVPIMLVVLKIPTRMTIATSLAITFISSIGSTVGKLTTGQVDYIPALIMVVASLIASPLEQLREEDEHQDPADHSGRFDPGNGYQNLADIL